MRRVPKMHYHCEGELLITVRVPIEWDDEENISESRYIDSIDIDDEAIERLRTWGYDDWEVVRYEVRQVPDEEDYDD